MLANDRRDAIDERAREFSLLIDKVKAREHRRMKRQIMIGVIVIVWRDEAGKRDYRVVKAKKADGRRVLVLWRDMDKLDPAVERRFLEARLKQDGPFDEAWINGDCAVPGVRSLDGLFKRLLEEEER